MSVSDGLQGMYAAATEIRKKLIGRTREEVRMEGVAGRGQAEETEVDRVMKSERKILQEVFKQYKVYTCTCTLMYIADVHIQYTCTVFSCM